MVRKGVVVYTEMYIVYDRERLMLHDVRRGIYRLQCGVGNLCSEKFIEIYEGVEVAIVKGPLFVTFLVFSRRWSARWSAICQFL